MPVDRPSGAGRPKRKLVAEWLRTTCRTAGARDTASKWPPRRDGVSIATLRRSKFNLGVKSAKHGKSGACCWPLPPVEEDQQACQSATCSSCAWARHAQF